MSEYTLEMLRLCGEVQKFKEWGDWVNERKTYLAQELSSHSPAKFMKQEENQRELMAVANIQSELIKIANFMTNVVLELFLRDIEMLIQRYMKKMRKSFAKMYWSEDMTSDPLDSSTYSNVEDRNANNNQQFLNNQQYIINHNSSPNTINTSNSSPQSHHSSSFSTSSVPTPQYINYSSSSNYGVSDLPPSNQQSNTTATRRHTQQHRPSQTMTQEPEYF